MKRKTTKNSSSLSSFVAQCKIKKKFKKPTKGGRVQSVPRDIGKGDDAMEFTLEQGMVMAQ
jgi:hypothetical protein